MCREHSHFHSCSNCGGTFSTKAPPVGTDLGTPFAYGTAGRGPWKAKLTVSRDKGPRTVEATLSSL
jgi:hypothetical protein